MLGLNNVITVKAVPLLARIFNKSSSKHGMRAFEVLYNSTVALLENGKLKIKAKELDKSFIRP
jgi:acyl-CoA hydrolase